MHVPPEACVQTKTMEKLFFTHYFMWGIAFEFVFPLSLWCLQFFFTVRKKLAQWEADCSVLDFHILLLYFSSLGVRVDTKIYMKQTQKLTLHGYFGDGTRILAKVCMMSFLWHHCRRMRNLQFILVEACVKLWSRGFTSDQSPSLLLHIWWGGRRTKRRGCRWVPARSWCRLHKRSASDERAAWGRRGRLLQRTCRIETSGWKRGMRQRRAGKWWRRRRQQRWSKQAAQKLCRPLMPLSWGLAQTGWTRESWSSWRGHTQTASCTLSAWSRQRKLLSMEQVWRRVTWTWWWWWDGKSVTSCWKTSLKMRRRRRGILTVIPDEALFSASTRKSQMHSYVFEEELLYQQSSRWGAKTHMLFSNLYEMLPQLNMEEKEEKARKLEGKAMLERSRMPRKQGHRAHLWNASRDWSWKRLVLPSRHTHQVIFKFEALLRRF